MSRERLVSRIRIALVLSLGAVASVLLGRFAYAALFSVFQPYDDEGYFLVSLAGYLDGAPLYDQVYSQYGPFFHVAGGLILRVFGLEPVSDAARFVTLAMWLSASLILALLTLIVTRRGTIALGALLLSFGLLATLSNEPLHPGALIVVLLATIALVIALIPRWPRAASFALGAAAAALALTKTNVGGLSIVSIAFLLILLARPRKPVAIVASICFVATPGLLMLADLGQDAFRSYAIVVTLAAAGLALSLLRQIPGPNPGRLPIRWVVAGGAASALVVVSIVIARGTTVRSLLVGTVLAPLQQREAFSLPLHMPTWTIVWGVTGLAMALAWTLLAARTDDAGPNALPWLKLGAGAVIWLGLAGVAGVGGQMFALGLPVAWVAAVPPRGQPVRDHLLLLPAIAVLQTLHAYPVAGSQLTWSALLLVPTGAICLSDGLDLLWGRAGALSRSWRLVFRAAYVTLLGAFTAWLTLASLLPQHRAHRDAYATGVVMGLPGATRVRLPAAQVAVYRDVTELLRRDCSTFVGLPGMNSFYAFTGQEPPTYLNATAWMYLFDEPTQRQIIGQLRPIEDLCVLRNPELVQFWSQGRPLPQGPLLGYIDGQFEPVGRVAGYEILARSRVT